jgi:hypothetical protein
LINNGRFVDIFQVSSLGLSAANKSGKLSRLLPRFGFIPFIRAFSALGKSTMSRFWLASYWRKGGSISKKLPFPPIVLRTLKYAGGSII